MAEQEAAPQAAAKAAPPPVPAAEMAPLGLIGGAKHWIVHEGLWWACSFVFHVTLVCSLALISSKAVEKVVDEAPSFQEANLPEKVEVPQQIERFEVSQTPQDPTELNNETLSLEKPAQIMQDEKKANDSTTMSEQRGGGTPMAGNQPNLGGLGGFDIQGIGAGPAVKGKGGVGKGVGTGTHAGSGGDDFGFGTRTGGRKAMLGSGGGTRQSERAVAGALNWLARHQSRDGSWSLVNYKANCKDPSCTGDTKVGSYESAATALALLPFLGAGQTHKVGLYHKTVYAGVAFLIKNQKPDGDLRMGQTMYAHGLAAIALCECYGISNDKLVGRAAQGALNFIMQSQDPAGGGWRYAPRDPGDTSVTGWQLMALKSGQMAYLNVSPVVFERAKFFLKACSGGKRGGLFSYTPGGGPTVTMTAVGLLCEQYMHMGRSDAAMIEGTTFVLQNMPDPNARNIYYWYYATQVMHNQLGANWDNWNRRMRRTLIDAQCKDNTCAAGSWNPVKPAADAWAQGGRLMMTSLSALVLEVYYRYLPLYKIEEGVDAGPAPSADRPAKPAEKATDKPADKKPAEKKPAEKKAVEKKAVEKGSGKK